MTVDNKIVLITGANRGIGHSIMSAFINAGYIVVELLDQTMALKKSMIQLVILLKVVVLKWM